MGLGCVDACSPLDISGLAGEALNLNAKHVILHPSLLGLIAGSGGT